MPSTISCTPFAPARWIRSSIDGIRLSPPSSEKRFCPTYLVVVTLEVLGLGQLLRQALLLVAGERGVARVGSMRS
jgi:hypothetical protein